MTLGMENDGSCRGGGIAVAPRQLTAIPLFEGLPETDLALLATTSRERRYGKGTLILLKGDRPTGLFAVLSGTIKLLCQSPRGGERVIDLPGAGQVFGEAALLLSCPYPYSATALTATRLLHVDGEALLAMVEDSPDFCRRMLSRISHGICNVIGDLEDYRMRDPRERVARFLLDGSAATARSDSAITFSAPRHVVASRLGMTPESLSRAMRDMAEAGLIEVGRCAVRVLDRQRLAVLLC
jgi:CRP-like cAMP-binding protein